MKQQVSLGLRSEPVQQVQTTIRAVIAAELRAVQECNLCKQGIFAKRQAPLNTILIEKYYLCPSCCQPVKPEIATTLWYRRRWQRRVAAISKKKGWGWEKS
jgi:hypothetical protein